MTSTTSCRRLGRRNRLPMCTRDTAQIVGPRPEVGAERGDLLARSGLIKRDVADLDSWVRLEQTALLCTDAVMGPTTELRPDRAALADGLEVPAVLGARELGRFALTPDDHTLVSAEERPTAATIGSLFANVAGPRS